MRAHEEMVIDNNRKEVYGGEANPFGARVRAALVAGDSASPQLSAAYQHATAGFVEPHPFEDGRSELATLCALVSSLPRLASLTLGIAEVQSAIDPPATDESQADGVTPIRSRLQALRVQHVPTMYKCYSFALDTLGRLSQLRLLAMDLIILPPSQLAQLTRLEYLSTSMLTKEIVPVIRQLSTRHALRSVTFLDRWSTKVEDLLALIDDHDDGDDADTTSDDDSTSSLAGSGATLLPAHLPSTLLTELRMRPTERFGFGAGGGRLSSAAPAPTINLPACLMLFKSHMS